MKRFTELRKARPVICPKCGKEALSTVTPLGRQHFCCDLWSYNGKPLVNKKTHEARKRAHLLFDPLWQTGWMTRSEAYRALRGVMGLSSDQCHFGEMDLETLRKVPDAINQIKFRHHVKPPENSEQ